MDALWKKQGDVKSASQQLNYAKMYWRLGIIGGIGMMASGLMLLILVNKIGRLGVD
jgi:hypothetical protein